MMLYLRRLLWHLQTNPLLENLSLAARARLSDELRTLMAQEDEYQKLLGLHTKLRLSLVDEEAVILLRPADRDQLELEEDDCAASPALASKRITED